MRVCYVLGTEGYIEIGVICCRSCIFTRKTCFQSNKPVRSLFSFWLKCDDHDGSEIEKIKQEITHLRNSVFQEVYREQEEYVST